MNLLNIMTLRNDKVQDNKLKSFWKQKSEVSIKTFCRKWEGETLPKWLVIYKQPEECQSGYYPDNLDLISFCIHTSLQVLLFLISLLKRNLRLHWKWQTFEEKISPFFMTSKKKEILFLTHLFLIFVNK